MNPQELLAPVTLRPGAVRSANRATQSKFMVSMRYHLLGLAVSQRNLATLVLLLSRAYAILPYELSSTG